MRLDESLSCFLQELSDMSLLPPDMIVTMAVLEWAKFSFPLLLGEEVRSGPLAGRPLMNNPTAQRPN